jgi:hypothetical protein
VGTGHGARALPPRPLRGAALDGYYREFVRVGHALGGTGLPTTKSETLDCLYAYLPRLAVTPGKADRTGPNLRGGATNLFTGRFMDWAMRDTLPDWAARMVMYRPPGLVTRRSRRAALWLALNGPHALTGPIEEFRQAQARVAAGTTTAHTTPAYRPGTDPARTRAEAEAIT